MAHSRAVFHVIARLVRAIYVSVNLKAWMTATSAVMTMKGEDCRGGVAASQ